MRFASIEVKALAKRSGFPAGEGRENPQGNDYHKEGKEVEIKGFSEGKCKGIV